MQPISRISTPPEVDLQPLPKAVHSQFGSSSISESSGSCIFAPFRAIWNFFAWIKSLICCESTKPAYELPKFTVETFAKMIGAKPEEIRQDSEGCFRIGTKREVTFRVVPLKSQNIVEFTRNHASAPHWSIRELLSPAFKPLNCYFHGASTKGICQDPEIKAFGYQVQGGTGLKKQGDGSICEKDAIIDHLKNHWDLIQGAEVKDDEPYVYDHGKSGGKISYPQWKVQGLTTHAIFKVVPYGEEDFALEMTEEGPLFATNLEKINLIVKDYEADKTIDLKAVLGKGWVVQGKDLVRLKSKE